MKDRLYIPARKITPSLHAMIDKNFTKEIEVFVDPMMCRECSEETEGETPCSYGAECPYRYTTLTMYDRIRTPKGNAIGLWRGNLPLIMELFKGYQVVDSRARPKADKTITFTGELFDHQKLAVKQWFAAKHGGQIIAPARSGKTVIVVYITVRLGLKTLILTHQKDLLHQFYDSFMEFTNASKTDSVGLAEKGDVLKLYEQGKDIILAPYQTFLSANGKLRHRELTQKIGLLCCDEVHVFGADRASKIITRFNCFYRLGVTATPERKDGRDILAKYAMGDIVSKVEPEQLSGKAIFIHTEFEVGAYNGWHTMLNRLARSVKRNKLIVRYSLKDVKDGHYVLVVTERKKQCEELEEMFKEAGVSTLILYGPTKNRPKLEEDLRQRRYKVTVATRKVVQYGINIPPWSAYHCVSPTNNKPNFYQEMSRVRTPDKNKLPPVIRYYTDIFSGSEACVRTVKKVLREEKFEFKEVNLSGEDIEAINKRRRKKDKFAAIKETERTINTWNKFVGINE